MRLIRTCLYGSVPLVLYGSGPGLGQRQKVALGAAGLVLGQHLGLDQLIGVTFYLDGSQAPHEAGDVGGGQDIRFAQC